MNTIKKAMSLSCLLIFAMIILFAVFYPQSAENPRFGFLISCSHEEFVEAIQKNPELVNLRNRLGLQPLHYFCWFGNNEKARTLLENGADPDAKVECAGQFAGYTPLHFSAINGDIKILDLLYFHNASFSCVSDRGDTPLTISKKNRHISYFEQVQRYQKQK